ERIVDLIGSHRSTIVFANSRRLAERLCARLNEIAFERRHGPALPDAASPAEVIAQSGSSRGAPQVIARAHHGSVSREQRLLIEELRYPRNPLDVLAQQIVAMVAMDDWPVDDLATLVRRAAPFADLPSSGLEGVLDMLAGRYPSDEFAELRPRLNWDRTADVVSARPGAQRLAVTAGGTIPERGPVG